MMMYSGRGPGPKTSKYKGLFVGEYFHIKDSTNIRYIKCNIHTPHVKRMNYISDDFTKGHMLDMERLQYESP